MSKRKFFSLAEKLKIIDYANEKPNLSSTKLTVESVCRRTCIQTLTKQKKIILNDWNCHENLCLTKKEDLKNPKMSTMLSGVGLVWKGKH